MDVNNIKVFENTSFVQECFELDKKIFLDNYSLQMINDDSLKELFFLKKDEELIGFIFFRCMTYSGRNCFPMSAISQRTSLTAPVWRA